MKYEFIARNKFLTIDATSLDEIIDGLKTHVAFLEELKEAGVVYSQGAEDDCATLITENEDVANKYGFEPEFDPDDEEDEFDPDDEEDEFEDDGEEDEFEDDGEDDE